MTEQNHAVQQAKNQYEFICALVAAMDIDWDRFEELRTLRDEHISQEGQERGEYFGNAYPEEAKELADLEKIVEGYSWKSQDDVSEAIQQDPLEVSVGFSGWYTPGEKPEPDQYRILLCTGGPAVQITGKLDEHNEPESAEIQHQDWGTPWTGYHNGIDEEVLLKYARQFYFGE